MANGRNLIFWIVIFIVACALVWLLRQVLLPFVAGVALAYMLAPVADRLQRLGISRTIAALAIVAIVLLAILATALLVIPLLVQQGLALLANIPRYVARVRELIVNAELPFLRTGVGSWIGGGDSSKTASDLLGYASTWLTTFAYSILAGGRALVSVVSVLIIMPVVTFYLICDWHTMIEALDGLIPLRHRETLRALAREIDVAISGFLRGQLGVCVVLGLYYALALTLIGLNFGFLIGSLSGLVTFVPYVGSLSGLLVATSVAIAQFWPDWKWIVAVIGIFLVGQFVEGNIISPKLVGKRVGLHPVWIIFAMFTFGYLFGFVGLLVAVPLAASIAVLSRFGVRQYLASPMYKGDDPLR